MLTRARPLPWLISALVPLCAPASEARAQDEESKPGLFQPNAEAFHDFYAERPISVRMLGDYHQFGEFVSGVAALPRVVILTMHDIALRRANDRDVGVSRNDGRLILEGSVKTYRYIDEEEAAERAQATAGAP